MVSLSPRISPEPVDTQEAARTSVSAPQNKMLITASAHGSASMPFDLIETPLTGAFVAHPARCLGLGLAWAYEADYFAMVFTAEGGQADSHAPILLSSTSLLSSSGNIRLRHPLKVWRDPSNRISALRIVTLMCLFAPLGKMIYESDAIRLDPRPITELRAQRYARDVAPFFHPQLAAVKHDHKTLGARRADANWTADGACREQA
jgi:hypothetical protein